MKKILILILILMLCIPYKIFAEWGIQTIDSGGQYSSIAIDSNNYPHIAYSSKTYTALKYAKFTGNSWLFQSADDNNKAKNISLVLDTNNYSHISYQFKNDGYAEIHYSSWTGTAWSWKYVDNYDYTGKSTSISLDTNGYPHINTIGSGQVKYTNFTGTAWSTIQEIDSNSDYSSLSLDSNNYPQISYYKVGSSYEFYDLKYTSWTGTSWAIQTIDSIGNVGNYNSIVIDTTTNNIHISYYDTTNGDLKYAKWTGTSWSIQTIDSADDVGLYTSIALDTNNYPHISYYDLTNGNLKYASWSGTGWNIQTVDSVGDVGNYTTSLDIDANDNPHISYFDATNDKLKYAKWTNNPTLSWTDETNYDSGGVYPVTGSTTTVYTYRVKYIDADNDAPVSGYPKLYIKKGGVNIVGSPFTMDAVDTGDTTYSDGKLYTYSKLLLGGTNYTYSFDAYDVWNATAIGTPTTAVDAPDASFNTPSVTGDLVWTTKASMPITAYNSSAGVIDRKIYVIGGYGRAGSFITWHETNYEYNTISNVWNQRASLPDNPPDQGRQLCTVGIVSNKLYILGGTSASYPYLSLIQEYDPVGNTWTTKTAMPTARSGLACGVVNNKIYAIGGTNGSSLSTVEEYDPVGNTWTTKTAMPTARSGLACGVVNNKIYTVGGNNGNYLSIVEEYDTETNIWIAKTNMPTAREGLAVGVVSNKIYAIGGTNGSSLSTVEEYDPTNDTWTSVTSMPTARTGLVCSVIDNKIYAIEGYTSMYVSIVEEGIVTSTPTLSWTNETNYDLGGVYPTSGLPSNTSFVYRVKYTDADNEAPLSGYPKVHIKKAGVEISGSPFTMSEVDAGDTTYSDGKIYTYEKIITSTGTDYTYYFEAQDINGAVASGTPTTAVDAPDVITTNPVLSWTNETNYSDKGVYPTTTTLHENSFFVYRLKYTDADNDAPATGYPKLYVKKGGTNIAGSPFIMTADNPADTTYTDGKIYFSSMTLSLGSDYTYYFEGYDVWNATATGTPTTAVDAPDVIDVTIPESVANLTALTNSTLGSVMLSWTAPNDDAGAVLSYVLKYSVNQITNQTDFNNATTYAQSWTPANPGEAESKTLTNITGGATYYFAIESIDTSSNTSIISNVSSCFIKGIDFDHYEIVVATSISAGSNFALRINAKNSSNDSMPDFSGNVSIQTVLASNEALAGGGVLGVASASLSNGTVIIYNQTYTKAENIKFKVTDSNSKTGTSSAITVLGVADNTSNLSISANPSSIVTGQSSEITATLTDVYGNLLSNIYVEFSVVKGSGTISATSVLTNSQGQAKVTFTRNDTNKAEVNTIRATMGTITADINVNVGIMIYSAAGGTIVASEDPNTTVTIPPNAIGSDVYICIKKLVDIVISIKNKANNATDKDKEKIISDSIREFSAFMNDGSSYSNNFNDYVTVEMPYTDDDNNNIVDGTNISVDDLKVLRLDETKEEWQVVSDGGENKVDKINKIVKAQVKHFSIYTIGKAISSNLDNIKVYPNPINFSRSVRNTLKFGNLPRNPDITIYNISGRLVRKLTFGTASNDGTSGKVEWDGKNEEGDSVEMGLYIYIIKDENGDKKTGRFGVIK